MKKKKLIIFLIGLGIIFLIIVGLIDLRNVSVSEIEKAIKIKYQDYFEIRTVSSEKNAKSYKVKMTADDIQFTATGSFNSNCAAGIGCNSYTSNLSYSLYKKYKKEILNLALKYNLEAQYTKSSYSNDDILYVKGTENQEEAIYNFCREVVNISEINNFYQLKYPFVNGIQVQTTDPLTHDYSRVEIISNNKVIKSFSIMEKVYQN